MNNLNFFGNHRGGTGIVNELPDHITRLYNSEWILADPKEDRAKRLAMVVKNRFPLVHTRPLRMKAQDALAYSHDNDTLVLAMDTIADITETLEVRRKTQRTTFQIVGRGPDGNLGVRIGIQGTLLPGDSQTEKSTLLLMNTLKGLTQEASSRVLTEPDPLTASILRPMRELVTRHTVRHLMEKGKDPWDLSLGPLSVTLGATTYPLVSVQAGPQDRYSHRKDLALDVAGKLPIEQLAEYGSGKFAIIAVVVIEERTIYFIKVVQNMTGKRRVDGTTIFAPPPKPLPFSYIDSAVFTD
jgi:hypothetical protein